MSTVVSISDDDYDSKNNAAEKLKGTQKYLEFPTAIPVRSMLCSLSLIQMSVPDRLISAEVEKARQSIADTENYARLLICSISQTRHEERRRPTRRRKKKQQVNDAYVALA